LEGSKVLSRNMIYPMLAYIYRSYAIRVLPFYTLMFPLSRVCSFIV